MPAANSKRHVTDVMALGLQKRYLPRKHYAYVLRVTWSEGSEHVIYRRFSVVHDFHNELEEMFPLEAGVIDEKERILPRLPGRILLGRTRTQKIAEKRLLHVGKFCRELIALPPRISRCKFVLRFFEAKREDINPPSEEALKKPALNLARLSKCQSKQPEIVTETPETAEPPTPIEVSSPLALEPYRTIAAYERRGENEISFESGLQVDVMEKTRNGWWFICIDDDQGWAPASYLEPLTLSVGTEQEGKAGNGKKYIATHEYHAQEEDELDLEKGTVVELLTEYQDGWWLVRYNGKEGYTPCVFLTPLADPIINVKVWKNPNRLSVAQGEKQALLSETPNLSSGTPTQPIRSTLYGLEGLRHQLSVLTQNSTENNSTTEEEQPNSNTDPSDDSFESDWGDDFDATDSESAEPEQYRAIAAYQSMDDTEISLEAGDTVDVIKKNENGWWYVTCKGQSGWAPASYLEPVDHCPEKDEIALGEGERYISKFDYHAENEDEVDFERGETLVVLRKYLDGWWLVKFNDKEGFAPSTYLAKEDVGQSLEYPYGGPAEGTNAQTSDEETQIAEKAPPPRRCTISVADSMYPSFRRVAMERVKSEECGSPSPEDDAAVSCLGDNWQLKSRDPRDVLMRNLPPPPTESGSIHGGKPTLKRMTSAEEEARRRNLETETYRAVGAYEKTCEKEVSFTAGATVHVIHKNENGWWYVWIGKDEGWAPGSYLEPIDHDPQRDTVFMEGRSSAYITTHAYSPQMEDELQFDKGQRVEVIMKNLDGWWLVSIAEKQGFAPATYLKKVNKVSRRYKKDLRHPRSRPGSTSSSSQEEEMKALGLHDISFILPEQLENAAPPRRCSIMEIGSRLKKSSNRRSGVRSLYIQDPIPEDP
ncbi:SH3 and PX domain-containing protein 2A-like [Branchiostoma floridae x Branchiostoma japonicum]